MLKKDMERMIEILNGRLAEADADRKDLLADIKKLKEVQQKYKAQTMRVEEAQHSITAIKCITCPDFVPLEQQHYINEDRRNSGKEEIAFEPTPDIQTALMLIENILRVPVERIDRHMSRY